MQFLLTHGMLLYSFSSIVQQVRTWLSHLLQGGWSRVPTQDLDAPTALGAPLIPEPSLSSPQQASASQRTGMLLSECICHTFAVQCGKMLQGVAVLVL